MPHILIIHGPKLKYTLLWTVCSYSISWYFPQFIVVISLKPYICILYYSAEVLYFMNFISGNKESFFHSVYRKTRIVFIFEPFAFLIFLLLEPKYSGVYSIHNLVMWKTSCFILVLWIAKGIKYILYFFNLKDNQEKKKRTHTILIWNIFSNIVQKVLKSKWV